jgi:hypothetical protein
MYPIEYPLRPSIVEINMFIIDGIELKYPREPRPTTVEKRLH